MRTGRGRCLRQVSLAALSRCFLWPGHRQEPTLVAPGPLWKRLTQGGGSRPTHNAPFLVLANKDAKHSSGHTHLIYLHEMQVTLISYEKQKRSLNLLEYVII